MNVEELQRVQSNERRADTLQNLRPSFYQEVGEYLASLKAERERAAAEAADPFASPEVNRLTDEIETATDVVEAIYDRRMGKIVKQASLAAADMPADDEGLTAEEADLFAELVEAIRSNKRRVLDVLDQKTQTAAEMDLDAGGETPPPPPDPPAGADETVSAAAAMGGTPPSEEATAEATAADADGGSADGGLVEDGSPTQEAPPTEDGSSHEDGSSVTDGRDDHDDGSRDAEATAATASTPGDPSSDESAEASEPKSVDRVTVRITEDVGPILGLDDREYTLATDDVVSLPEQNATPLVERDAAEPLE